MKYWDAMTDMPFKWSAPTERRPAKHGGELAICTATPKPVGPLPEYLTIQGQRVDYGISPKGWGIQRAYYLCPVCSKRIRKLYQLTDGRLGCWRHRPRKQHIAERKLDRAGVARTRAARKLRNSRWAKDARPLLVEAERLEAQAARLGA